MATYKKWLKKWLSFVKRYEKSPKRKQALMQGQRDYIESHLLYAYFKVYPTFMEYLNSEMGRVYLDSMGRQVHFIGREHEVRNAQYIYTAHVKRAKELGVL